MITLQQSVISTQYIQIAINAISNGAAYNPTNDVVQMAFVPVSQPPGTPSPDRWQTASWETDPGPVYWAQILVGPANGGVALTAGGYVAWVMVTDNPEIPAFPGCYLIMS